MRISKLIGATLLILNCLAIIGHHKNRALVNAFSTNPPPSPPTPGPNENDDAFTTIEDADNGSPQTISRRDIFNWPFLAVGSAVITGELLSAAIGGASLSRPPAHDQRVADIIRRSLVASAATLSSPGKMRVLEVGMGKDCRLIRRGLYNQGIAQLSSSGGKQREVEITGLDLAIPKDSNVKDAQLLLDQVGQNSGVKATVKVQQGSITDNRLPFADGSFDVVICCLTLCSVTDPKRAVEEMKRLVRPAGTLGYIEHVAVNQDEPYRFLEWQQTNLDSLQQLVADNCHLHRYTQETIHQVFDDETSAGGAASKTIFEDRFLVDKMWPVSSQACGVIQRGGVA